jgi:hypothetical protein
MMATVNEHQIEHAMGGAHRYWMADGIVEIVLGSTWLVWGGIVFLPTLIPDPRMATVRVIALLVSMAALPMMFGRLIKGWKERLTFPRTGYVELRKHKSRMRLVIVIPVAATAFMISLLSSHGPNPVRYWMPLALSLVMSLSFLWTAWRIGSLRLGLMSWLVTAAGIVTTAMNTAFAASCAVLLLTSGTVLVGDGLLSMRTYLRKHPLPAGEQ